MVILNLNLIAYHALRIGGLVHGQLMTKAGIQSFIQMDDIDMQRSQLVATLSHQMSMLSTNLTSSTQSLSQALAQLSKPEE